MADQISEQQFNEILDRLSPLAEHMSEDQFNVLLDDEIQKATPFTPPALPKPPEPPSMGRTLADVERPQMRAEVAKDQANGEAAFEDAKAHPYRTAAIIAAPGVIGKAAEMAGPAGQALYRASQHPVATGIAGAYTGYKAGGVQGAVEGGLLGAFLGSTNKLTKLLGKFGQTPAQQMGVTDEGATQLRASSTPPMPEEPVPTTIDEVVQRRLAAVRQGMPPAQPSLESQLMDTTAGEARARHAEPPVGPAPQDVNGTARQPLQMGGVPQAPVQMTGKFPGVISTSSSSSASPSTLGDMSSTLAKQMAARLRALEMQPILRSVHPELEMEYQGLLRSMGQYAKTGGLTSAGTGNWIRPTPTGTGDRRAPASSRPADKFSVPQTPTQRMFEEQISQLHPNEDEPIPIPSHMRGGMPAEPPAPARKR